MQQPKGKTKKKEPVNLCYDSELGFLPCDEMGRIREGGGIKEIRKRKS